MARRIIQMFTSPDYDEPCALADDGTTWRHLLDTGEWLPLYGHLPQDDAHYEPTPPRDDRWRPAGYLVWCVDTTENTACKVPNKAVFLRWANAGVKHWIMVQAHSDLQALAVVRDREKPNTTIETEQIVIDGTPYRTLTDIPF